MGRPVTYSAIHAIAKVDFFEGWDCSDEIQIHFFHLNQINGSSAEITISTKPH